MRQFNRHVSQEIEDFIFWLLEKNPEMRPKNGLIVHTDLKQIVGKSFVRKDAARVRDLPTSMATRADVRQRRQEEITAARPWSEVEGMLAAVGLLKEARDCS